MSPAGRPPMGSKPLPPDICTRTSVGGTRTAASSCFLLRSSRSRLRTGPLSSPTPRTMPTTPHTGTIPERCYTGWTGPPSCSTTILIPAPRTILFFSFSSSFPFPRPAARMRTAPPSRRHSGIFFCTRSYSGAAMAGKGGRPISPTPASHARNSRRCGSGRAPRSLITATWRAVAQWLPSRMFLRTPRPRRFRSGISATTPNESCPRAMSCRRPTPGGSGRVGPCNCPGHMLQ